MNIISNGYRITLSTLISEPSEGWLGETVVYGYRPNAHPYNGPGFTTGYVVARATTEAFREAMRTGYLHCWSNAIVYTDNYLRATEVLEQQRDLGNGARRPLVVHTASEDVVLGGRLTVLPTDPDSI